MERDNISNEVNEKLKSTLKKINAIETVKDANSVISDEELILFVSFDLVNSTKFKTYNYSNWFNAIFTITERIRDEVKRVDNNFQLWRSIGDEVVFTIVISNKSKIEYIIQEIFNIVNITHLQIKDGSIFKKKFRDRDIYELREQNILSIKATAWIALVSKDPQNDKIKYNLEYEYSVADNTRVVEFQGNDIDTGFRISKKFTNPRRLTLSLELAYILSESKHVRPKLHIITYDRLKGIWDNKLYPVIWYHDEYIAGCKMESSFFYDEEEEQELVKKYLQYKRQEENKSKLIFKEDINFKLGSIINDRNLNFKMEKINKKLEKDTNDASSKALDIPSPNVEIHCAAVCVNNDDKIFMVKRSNDCNSFPGKWEFGCCKMITGSSFKEVLAKGYKELFNIDIEIDRPFKDYYFTKRKMKIPGIRYKAKIINFKEENIKLSEKYTQYKLVDLHQFREMKDQVIDSKEFEEIFLDVLDQK